MPVVDISRVTDVTFDGTVTLRLRYFLVQGALRPLGNHETLRNQVEKAGTVHISSAFPLQCEKNERL